MSLGGQRLSATAAFKGVTSEKPAAGFAYLAFTFAPARSNAATIASRSRTFLFHVGGVTLTVGHVGVDWQATYSGVLPDSSKALTLAPAASSRRSASTSKFRTASWIAGRGCAMRAHTQVAQGMI
jgi:hypothetical protein